MLSIGRVARESGVASSALRYYERLGLLKAERRSGRRVYEPSVLAHLAVIRDAQAAGFSLHEIQVLFAGRPYSRTMRELARRKAVELTERIAALQAMQRALKTALRCNCLSLEACGRLLLR